MGDRDVRATAARERAELDARAAVAGVDVMFADNHGVDQVSNLFAVVIGDAAVVVRAGEVVEVVTRKAFERGAYKQHDLFEHLRLFG